MMNIENIKKPETFEDLLELQKILDEEVGKPRENGFIPKERNYIKIVKSMIAEIIEFNEETENTHKTWKQKDFNKENMVEESVDILFFYLQLCNLVAKENDFREMLSKFWSEAWEKVNASMIYNEDIEIILINILSNTSWSSSISKLCDLMMTLVFLYDKNNISKEKVLNTYWSKWQKNMTRIKGDWTK